MSSCTSRGTSSAVFWVLGSLEHVSACKAGPQGHVRGLLGHGSHHLNTMLRVHSLADGLAHLTVLQAYWPACEWPPAEQTLKVPVMAA